MLTISNIRPGKLQPLTKVDYSKQPFKMSEPFPTIELDPKEEFLKNMGSLELHRTDNIPSNTEAYHKNYLDYLSRCWADHLGVVFTPDILWYTLLGELVLIVQKDVEKYRHLFSEKKEKQDIKIQTGDLIVMPLSLLIEELKDKVPTNTESFLPEFSTSTNRSKHAMRAMFCDMCSPYYNYMMFCCGIPAVDVRGEESDYQKIADNWNRLSDLFDEQDYFYKVKSILQDVVKKKEDNTFWKNMFHLERCGSGSQVEVKGWFSRLFKEYPQIGFPENFSTHVAKVSYEQLNTKKKYEMFDGLFYSHMNGDFLEPRFGFVVYETNKDNS